MMPPKILDAQQALSPGQPQGQPQEEMDYQKFVSELPQEFRAEIEEALTALLSYLYSDDGISTVIQEIQDAAEGKGDKAAQIGITALKSMDVADDGHEWSDSAKVFAGYFAVKEVANIAREAKIIDIPEEHEGKIFQMAAQNYIHGIIRSKPTPEARDAEAIRIQKEVEPLMTEKMRAAGYSVAKEQGIPGDEQMAMAAQAKYAKKPAQGGLLE